MSTPTLPRFATSFLVCMSAACGSAVPSIDTDGTTEGTTAGTIGTSADSTGDVEPPDGGVQLTVNRDVDILFVIDNSGSMGEEQGRLAADLGALIAVLEDPAVDANYRIGVTTTDNGNPWCGSTDPEAGNLEMSSCRARTSQFVFNGNPPADATAIACTDLCSADTIEILPSSVEFEAEASARPWLERTDGQTNLGGDVTMVEALQCALPQGIAGCGFESHLESMYKSFLRSQTEDEDEFGFIRTSAILSVVLLSDEVDCSNNNDFQSIFLSEEEGGNRVFWSDPGASAPTSAVCWNAGVVCEGSGTPYDSCRSSNKDTSGNVDVSDNEAVLHPIGRYVDFVQELEFAKQQITPGQEVLVSVIAGVPVGYDGELTYSNALDPVEQGDFGIGAGCTYDDGDPGTPLATARPPVRMREFAENFEIGEQPNVHSICQQSYAPVLEALGNAIRDQIRPPCMPVCVADTDQVTAGLQPSCTVLQEAPLPDGGGVEEVVVPQCAADGSVPDDVDVCYVPLSGDGLSEFCADFGWNLEFNLVRRAGVPAPGGTSIQANCEVSQNKQIDCPNLP